MEIFEEFFGIVAEQNICQITHSYTLRIMIKEITPTESTYKGLQVLTLRLDHLFSTRNFKLNFLIVFPNFLALIQDPGILDRCKY